MQQMHKPEKIHIGTNDFIISSIPAVPAQRMLIRAFGALSSGNIAGIPDSLIMELLSYTSVINSNGAEVRLENEELIGMLVDDPLELIELEAKMVEKNFGFFADGRLKKALRPIMNLLSLATDTPNT